jgi:hypothetical protein
MNDFFMMSLEADKMKLASLEKKFPWLSKRCAQLSEEVVEEEAKNMVDCDGKMVPDYACDGKGKDDLKESFTSKKDQLLFEKLTNKWAK